MKTSFNIDQAIENLVIANCGASATARDKHICRETLRGLTRLAVAEYAMNSRKDLDKTTDLVEAYEHA
jgi:hypothetical protein